MLKKIMLAVCFMSYAAPTHGAAIIFPLNQFLFTINFEAIGQQLGFTIATPFYLAYEGFFSPNAIIHYVMDILDEIEPHIVLRPEQQPMFHDRRISPILCEWLLSMRSVQEIHQIISSHLAQHKHLTDFMRTLLAKIADLLILNKNEIAHLLTPCKEGIEILQHCYNEQRHELHLLSNCNAELFNAIKEIHRDVFSLFNNIHISGETKHLRQHTNALRELVENHTLEFSECVYISTVEYGLEDARNMGIQTILCPKTNIAIAAEQLRNLGLIEE